MNAPRPRERLLLPLLVCLAAVAGLLVVVRREYDVARERVSYEDIALARLRRIAKAQLAFHEREGRYAWTDELSAAGLLPGLQLEERDGYTEAASPRYRLDVLLPLRVAPGGLVEIVPRTASEPSPELVKLHFAVVARPWGEARTGFRTFYADTSGFVFVSEGVSDVPSRTSRPLPNLLLTHGMTAEVAGLRWWRLDRLPPQ